MSGYSLKSFDHKLMSACVGALIADYGSIEVRLGLLDKFEGEKAIERLKRPFTMPLDISLNGARGSHAIRLSEHFAYLIVDVQSNKTDEQERIIKIIESTLQLRQPTEQDHDDDACNQAMNQRVVEVLRLTKEIAAGKTRAASSLRFRCFVSFRFDDHSKALALELKEFLELCEIEVVSGMGYEQRSVSAKVLERLSGSIDLFVVIFTNKGESAWLHQEIGVAKGRGIPIMVLREKSADLSEGLLSDIEYALFPPESVSAVFIPLLQAVRHVRINAQTKASPLHHEGTSRM